MYLVQAEFVTGQVKCRVSSFLLFCDAYGLGLWVWVYLDAYFTRFTNSAFFRDSVWWWMVV